MSGQSVGGHRQGDVARKGDTASLVRPLPPDGKYRLSVVGVTLDVNRFEHGRLFDGANFYQIDSLDTFVRGDGIASELASAEGSSDTA